MSRLRGANEESATESPTVLVISDSDDSGDELTGFSSPQKRYAGGLGPEPATMMEPPSAKKKMKIDGETTTEEAPIDIDSISTNPMRTRTKVSSDTSSKFPVSSPSDTVPLAGHRKKYVKNTLPAGAEWRMLQEIALGHPPITYMEKAAHWVCREELSDVEDVNNFDDQFQKREKFYSRSSSGRRNTGKESPYPNYNYQHFRSVILENLKGTPVGSSQESVGARKSSQLQPSCSKASTVHDESPAPTKPDSNNVTIYEKILCPSSESSTTKASPSIRLHWTDEESVFRCNRLNPDIDKYSQLIKVRIDYNKQIDLKAKINEIFKTPTVPIKYSSPPSEMVVAARTGRKSLDANSSNDTKSVDDQIAQEIVDRKIETRRSTGGKSNDSRRSSMRRSSQRKSSERGSTGRRSSERFPEVNCFQQDEFCNYLGLGMNGKVYSPTPTDNKRRSLRVKRLLVQTEALDKKNDKKKELKKKKIVHSTEEEEEQQKDGDKSKEERERGEEVTTTNNLNDQNRCSLPSSTFIEKHIGSSSPAPEEDESPISPNPLTPNTTNIACKTPEIKIITRLRNAATPPTKSGNAPSSVTTVNSNSTPPPTTRRQRRTRATSNGTSTCPRSSQSDDESPEKSAVPPRRRRLNHHHHPSHLHHHHPNDNDGSDLSESLQSDPTPAAAGNVDSGGGGGSGGSLRHNGGTSTIPSSSEAGKKDELNKRGAKEQEKDESAEWMHKKYQRYLEESRKTKPSIFIVESINNSEFKSSSMSVSASASAALSCAINNQKQNQKTPVIPKEHLSKESKSHKAKKWPKTRKRVLRRLLRRNGTVVGTFNQRILRNRIVFKSSRSKITKHQKVKVMKKEAIRMHLENEKSEKEEEVEREREEAREVEEETTEVESEKEMKRKKMTTKKKNKETLEANDHHVEINRQNKASQIDFEINNSSTDVQSAFSPIDPLALTPPPPPMTLFEEEDEEQEEIERAKSFEMCDVEIQTEPYSPPPSLPPITFLTEPSNRMPNPLTPENGRVIYAFYELDILTIVQDFMVTFWKTCKLIQVVGNTTEEWVHLGECKRLLFDNEINAPYKNRICVHNSIPIYMEMRAKELPKLNRDCCLISVYVNVYYYHDEELIAKSHSIQLDTVASLPQNVVYTTITDSRYFVMCWSQETMIGKTLSGLCKYSLTPHLDTLASIREFKSMRHEIRYLECTTDDNLIGFGDSQVTLWDHRSGDILMNYDLDMEIGNNLGSLHFPPLEVGHAKTVLIFQKTSAEELSIIAINVSHNNPSHQLVCKHILPPEFDNLKSTIAIDDYTILTNTEHQELWIDHSDPQYMVQIKTPEGQRRFYSRCKQNVIVITENHLALETFSSFVLKMSNFSTGM